MENTNRETAIKMTGVKKRYRLGQIGGGTLQADLQSWWARIRGKEDPNTKIGEETRLVGQTFMALNGIDLEIYKGEAVGIIGTNGAGKSTMLKLLSRVTAPTEGEIDIYGRIASMLEVGTGFSPEMTGRENVYMNGAILGMTKAEIDAKMEDIIEFSEVRDFIDTPVKRYSSGMYVKLAFSVAAHLDSEIMIMDEVLAVGDVNFQQKCLQKMKKVATEDGKTVLYVSHNMSTIRQLCSRCIVLDQGKCIFEGDVEEAIAIYTNRNAVEIKKEYDVSMTPRQFETTQKCHIDKIKINKGELDSNENLSFELHTNSTCDITNALLRFVLFNQSGNVIGMSYSELYSLKKGSNTHEFIFRTDKLAPGEYYVDLIQCEYDGSIQIRHDILNKVFAFEIIENEIQYNMKWNKYGWGPINFDKLTVR
ncbi:MAG: ATP-binding cassette domain-containing protein [Clostridia bacterium]|nr:ATP-binding cassette domain-containing protein [Clostridia bacterium]